MTTWHQEKAGLTLPGKGYIIVSDGLNVMQTRMNFGDEKERALQCLENFRKNQPKQSHILYKDGTPIT